MFNTLGKPQYCDHLSKDASYLTSSYELRCLLCKTISYNVTYFITNVLRAYTYDHADFKDA